ncbi:helix-turn-helix domain-containing protein [Streptomyces gardneri]|nr:helix-turn-helix domain-containing protein [Streptomyces gardneri]
MPSNDGRAERHRGPVLHGSGDEIWLSTEEVARRLKIPKKTLSAWAAAGRGPRFARMGRYRRYRVKRPVRQYPAPRPTLVARRGTGRWCGWST